MQSIRVRVLLAVSTVTIGLASSGSSAAVISFNLNYGPTAVPIPSASIGSLPLFNPALGTLTKVTLGLDANASAGQIAFDNEALVGSSVDIGIGAEVTAVALSALTSVAVPLQVGSSFVDADNDGAADFIGTDAFSVLGGVGNDTALDVSVLPATLTTFTGPGTFPVNLAASVATFLSTTGGFGPIDPVPGVTDGIVTVTYEFTPIPEPSSIALFAMGCVLVRRRRLRQR